MNILTAREIAARIWCDPDYEHVVMNPKLAEAIANLLLDEANGQLQSGSDEPLAALSEKGE